MAVDMKKALEALDMLVSALGMEESPEEPGTPPTEPEVKIENADTTPTPPAEKPEDKDQVQKMISAALATIVAPVQKNADTTATAINKLVEVVKGISEKQVQNEKSFEIMLEGFGLKEQVLKSFEEEKQKSVKKELSSNEVLLEIGKMFSSSVEKMASMNGQVNKSAPRSMVNVVQGEFGGQVQAEETDSVVSKSFVEGFAKVLKSKVG